MWYHPKYYKELRKLRNKLDQAISDEASTEATSVRPGPGPNLTCDSNADGSEGSSLKQQAPSSNKEQASSTKLQAFEPTRSIAKRQASQSE